MRFLLIAGFADSIVNFRGRLIEALIRKGIEVHVAAPALRSNGLVRGQLESMGATVHDIPLGRAGLNPLADFYAMLRLVLLMLRLRPRFVLGYTVKPVIYGSLAAMLARVPRRYALITGLGHAFQEDKADSLLRRIVEMLYAVSLRSTHRVFFQNADDEALFRARGLVRLTVATQVVSGSGVDVSEYSPAPLPQTPAFLLIARLLGDKGVRLYAEAARSLKRRYPAAVFRLVGWIDENPNAIRQDELDGWVRDGVIEHLGRLNDVRPAIAAASVFVLPTFYREGIPRTILEALAMGRAVVTTDTPGCRETVIDGENGYLVPPRSLPDLEAALEHFLRDPGLARRMGEKSRQLAESRFDVHAVNAAMLQGMDLECRLRT